jgi:uncharacterized protein YhbP (UPF0306 family)
MAPPGMIVAMRQADVERLVRDTLAAHASLFLATSGEAGPWVNGVYFAEDDLFTLALVLERAGRSVAAIRSQPRVAVIVSTGSPGDPFLQASADAEVLVGGAAEYSRNLLLAKVPQASSFLSAPVETVRLTVNTWRVTDIPNGWLPGVELPNPSRLLSV